MNRRFYWTMASVALAVLAFGSSASQARAGLLGISTRAKLAGQRSDSQQTLPGPPAVYHPKYCIKYWHHCTLRKTCCGLCSTQKIILEVKDPCCLPVEVPVCIPGCCTGIPHISTGRDILGRFSYTYEWCCGYKVDIVFRCRGDIMVHTWGR